MKSKIEFESVKSFLARGGVIKICRPSNKNHKAIKKMWGAK